MSNVLERSGTVSIQSVDVQGRRRHEMPERSSSESDLAHELTTANLLLDPSLESSIDTITCANFVDDDTNPIRFVVADDATLNYTNAFTVEFWINGLARTGKGETFISKADGASANEFWIGHRSSGGDQGEIECSISTDGSAEAIAIYRFSTGSGNKVRTWCHCVVRYDGGESTATDRLKMWLNGLQITDLGTGDNQLEHVDTMPTTVHNGASPIEIGASTYETAWRSQYSMSRTRFWTAALDEEDCARLFNNGYGFYHAELPAVLTTNLAVSLDMTEESGTRSDSSGNDNDAVETSGTVGSVKHVIEWRDQSQYGLKLRPEFNGFFLTDYVQAAQGTIPAALNFGRAPIYNKSASNGMTIEFDVHHKLQTNLPQNWPFSTGAVLMAFQMNSQLVDGEHFLWMVSGRSSTETYGGLIVDAATGWPSSHDIRWRLDSSPNGRIKAADNTVAGDTDYVSRWRWLGSGGADSVESYLNGTQQTLATFTSGFQNLGLDDLKGINVFCLGGLVRSDSTQGNLEWKCGTVCVTNGVTEDAIAETHMMSDHGLS